MITEVFIHALTKCQHSTGSFVDKRSIIPRCRILKETLNTFGHEEIFKYTIANLCVYYVQNVLDIASMSTHLMSTSSIYNSQQLTQGSCGISQHGHTLHIKLIPRVVVRFRSSLDDTRNPSKNIEQMRPRGCLSTWIWSTGLCVTDADHLLSCE